MGHQVLQSSRGSAAPSRRRTRGKAGRGNRAAARLEADEFWPPEALPPPLSHPPPSPPTFHESAAVLRSATAPFTAENAAFHTRRPLSHAQIPPPLRLPDWRTPRTSFAPRIRTTPPPSWSVRTDSGDARQSTPHESPESPAPPAVSVRQPSPASHLPSEHPRSGNPLRLGLDATSDTGGRVRGRVGASRAFCAFALAGDCGRPESLRGRLRASGGAWKSRGLCAWPVEWASVAARVEQPEAARGSLGASSAAPRDRGLARRWVGSRKTGCVSGRSAKGLTIGEGDAARGEVRASSRATAAGSERVRFEAN